MVASVHPPPPPPPAPPPSTEPTIKVKITDKIELREVLTSLEDYHSYGGRIANIKGEVLWQLWQIWVTFVNIC